MGVLLPSLIILGFLKIASSKGVVFSLLTMEMVVSVTFLAGVVFSAELTEAPFFSSFLTMAAIESVVGLILLLSMFRSNGSVSMGILLS